MKSIRPRLASALSCAALLAATGCVSQKEFSQACHERDQVASALTTTRADRARLNDQLTATTQELTRTTAERDAAWQDSQDLSVVLQAAIDRSNALDHQSTQTRAALAQTQASLETARRELAAAQQSLAAIERAGATAREQLALAQKRNEQLDTAVRAGQAALVDLRAQARAQAEEAAANLKQVKLDLEEARKDQAALVMVRERLTRAEASDAQARQRVTELEQSGAQLASKLETASTEVTKLKKEADAKEVQNVAARIAQAQVNATASRKIQTDLESARAKQTELQRAAEDARAQLAGSQKRVADLEARVKTLASHSNEGEAKTASDTTASVNPSN